MTVVVIPPRDPMARPPPLANTRTRLDARWIRQGDATQELAWRHQAIAVALSVFGGNPYICTQEEKRKRTPGCAPDIDNGLVDAEAEY